MAGTARPSNLDLFLQGVQQSHGVAVASKCREIALAEGISHERFNAAAVLERAVEELYSEEVKEAVLGASLPYKSE